MRMRMMIGRKWQRNGIIISNWCKASSYSAHAAPAPAPSPSSSAPKRKKLSIHQRRPIVESFVNKYREMNAGKFPTASATTKQVGGSYYNVKKIIQELEYKYKMSPSGSRKESPLIEAEGGGSQTASLAEKTFSEEVVKPTTPGSHSVVVATQSNLLRRDVKEVSPSCFEKPKDDEEEEIQHNPSDLVKAKIENVEILNVSHPCVEKSENDKKEEAQGDHSGLAATENHLPTGETDTVSHAYVKNAEVDRLEKTVYEDQPKVDGLELKEKQDQGSIEQDKIAIDMSTRQTNDAEVPKKPSLWGNFKSFADGIINIWRKM